MLATPASLTVRQIRLGPADAIPPGEGREFAVDGTLIAVFHTRSGALYATQALCPHRNGPLIDGLIGGDTLICPFHAWKFNLATGDALLGSCGLVTYPVCRDDANEIILTLP